MNDDCVILADALKHNDILQSLRLGGNPFTVEGWKAFSTLLCDL